MQDTLPDIWILWHKRRGDFNQMLALAEALGWPYTVKKLDFPAVGIPLLAGALLRRKTSDSLGGTWPQVIFCAEALCTIVARRLKRQSGNRIKIVVLGRPLGSPAGFDLVLTTAQYRLPPAPNVVELELPLINPARHAEGAVTPGPDTARPLTVALVGAASAPDRLDAAVAGEMAAALLKHAGATGGTLAVVTSPRTSNPVKVALARRLFAPHRLEADGTGYWRLLAMADEIIVTSDSVSMVADALSAGKPVSIYRLPLQASLGEWLYGTGFRPISWLFDKGVIEAPADRRRLFSKLVAAGRLRWFGEDAPLVAPGHDRNLPLAVKTVRELVSG
ncbi:hypothetical protein BH10PSE7_BH10PSE7_13980 [soil metagenome]